MDMIMPRMPLIKEFGRMAYDIIQQVRCLKRTNKNLESARDLLLPRLMNGEIAV
jgi:type I restriction enzyme S subunit